jgi:hypothetical protein
MTKLRTLLATLLLLTTASFCQQSSSNWQTKLHQQLPLLGHRNWILIVDSAYPLQVSPGIETIETGATQLPSPAPSSPHSTAPTTLNPSSISTPSFLTCRNRATRT